MSTAATNFKVESNCPSIEPRDGIGNINAVIKGKKCKDGFSFNVSVQHIIEQTLLRTLKSPAFKKSTILISDEIESSDDESSEKTEEVRSKGMPIKLHMKRKYADDVCNKPKRRYSEKPHESVSAIPPGWIMRGLTRADHMKFQKSVANASLSPFQKRKLAQAKQQAVNTKNAAGTPSQLPLQRPNIPLSSPINLHCTERIPSTNSSGSGKSSPVSKISDMLPDLKGQYPSPAVCSFTSNSMLYPPVSYNNRYDYHAI